MNVVWLGLFSGIAFGFVIQRIGATNPDKMARAHLMIDPVIPRFMLTAVLFTAIGLLGLRSFDVSTTNPLPLSIVATGLAGLLFGVGWGITGYCPGTTWAAAGEGRMDAVFALLGGIAGSALFAHYHETLIPALYAPSNQGPLTLYDWVTQPALAVLILVAAFGGAVFLIGHFWGKVKLRDDE